MTRYIVRPPYLGNLPTLEISRERHDSIWAAYEYLAIAASVEEKYDILVENYRELESDLLGIALDNQVYSEFSVVRFSSIRRQVSRRVANLLSAVRLYIDSLAQEDAGLSAVHQEIHDLYDREPDFRLLESLRNYAQHKGLPFGFSMPSSRIDAGDRVYFSFHASVQLNVDEFLQDPKVKALIREDLQSHAGQLLPLDLPIRHYVGLLSNLQQKTRELASQRTTNSEAELLRVIADYSTVDPRFGRSEQKVLGLHEWEDGERLPATTRIVTGNVLTNLSHLREKNRALSNLAKGYVSGLADSDSRFLRNIVDRNRGLPAKTT